MAVPVSFIRFHPKKKHVLVIVHGAQFRVFDLSTGQFITPTEHLKKSVDSTEAKSENQEEGGQEDKEEKVENRIVAARFNEEGSLFATVTDDDKVLRIWKCDDWTEVSARTTKKRATSLTFSPDGKFVVICDKAGDVYNFSCEDEADGKLILGHLSMLLDIIVNKDNIVFTADRDEKIRMSRYPLGHNIEGYCLGHKEFVSRIALLPSSSLLVSGSGDGTVRLWDYAAEKNEAKKLACVKTSDAIATVSDAEKVGSNADSSDVAEAVEGPIPCAVDVAAERVFVALEDTPFVLVLSSSNRTLALQQVLRVSGHVATVSVQDGTTLWVATNDEGKPVVVFREKEGEFVEVSEYEGVSAAAVVTVQGNALFSGHKAGWAGLKTLKKKNYNNLPEYFERKQARIDELNEKRSKKRGKPADSASPDAKKVKTETAE
eukprot:Colp12_sorted_trinity150504_noHs@21544